MFRSTTAPDRRPRVKTWRVANVRWHLVVDMHKKDTRNGEYPKLDLDSGSWSEKSGGHLRQSATLTLPTCSLVPRGGSRL
jgi:hypothetical protein